jgi:hypothetical protein
MNDTTDAIKGFFTVVFGAAVVAIVMFVGTLWAGLFEGLAAWQLYQWFVRSTFETAPNLSGWHLVGLLMLIHLGVATRKTDTPEDKKGDKTYGCIMLVVTSPMVAGLTVFTGWIIAKAAGLI